LSLIIPIAPSEIELDAGAGHERGQSDQHGDNTDKRLVVLDLRLSARQQ
jgi:hypothetical protein